MNISIIGAMLKVNGRVVGIVTDGCIEFTDEFATSNHGQNATFDYPYPDPADLIKKLCPPSIPNRAAAVPSHLQAVATKQHHQAQQHLQRMAQRVPARRIFRQPNR